MIKIRLTYQRIKSTQTKKNNTTNNNANQISNQNELNRIASHRENEDEMREKNYSTHFFYYFRAQMVCFGIVKNRPSDNIVLWDRDTERKRKGERKREREREREREGDARTHTERGTNQCRHSTARSSFSRLARAITFQLASDPHLTHTDDSITFKLSEKCQNTEKVR